MWCDVTLNPCWIGVNATKPDTVKWHDDKSTYTGVYAKGGPTNVDHKITLSNLADRSVADARGVKRQ